MSKTTTFTVPQVPGSKRASARVYTHALVGRYSGERAAAVAEIDLRRNGIKWRSWDRSQWNYYAADAKRAVGDVRRNHNGYPMAMKDYELKIAQDFIAENPTLEGYLGKQRAAQEARIASLRAKGLGELQVLQWSMSKANAAKAMTSFMNRGYAQVNVVECVPVVKAAKAAKGE